MGASEFITTATGRTAEEAFRAAREDALYEYGHRGYTGSVAEKSHFVMIAPEAPALKARLERAIEGLRVLQRDLRAGGTEEQLRGLIGRLGVQVFLDPFTLARASRAQAQKAIREEIARLRALRAQCKVRMKPEQLATILLEIGDRRIDDKWGPAGCIDLTPKKKRDKEFLFFGLASC
jgi:hypothetical protein